MLGEHLKRGTVAGAVGGLAYGLFVAFVANPLVGFAETFEHGHGHAHTEPVVEGAVAAATSVVGGVAFGVLVGVLVFGAAYYFLEPAVPGAPDTRSYLLAAAGFLTGFGAPWLALPPRPPGVENALSTDARLAVYVAMMVVGAVACLGAVFAYRRLRPRGRLVALAGAALALALVPLAALLAPANPTTGPVPGRLAAVFRGVVVLGHVVLWGSVASVHAWLSRRAGRSDRDGAAGTERGRAVDAVPRAD